VLGHDRAARKAPDAAVNHAHAEAAGLTVRVGGDAAAAATAASATTTSAPSSASASSTSAGESARESSGGGTAGVKTRIAARKSDAHLESDVRVTAALHLRFTEHDVGEALELGLPHVAARCLRDQIGDQIGGIERDT